MRLSLVQSVERLRAADLPNVHKAPALFRERRAFGDSRIGQCQGGFGLLQARQCFCRCLGAFGQSVLNTDVMKMSFDLELDLGEDGVGFIGIELL
ncbi:hypothetical protein D3C72_1584890 [compost metagenome]